MLIRVVVGAVAFGVLISAEFVFAQRAADVETILYQAADTLGMLRTSREVDGVATMIYSGTGVTVVDGRTCAMENYRASVRYPIPNAHHTFPVPGMRVDFRCAADDGESERHVQVVAGELAWNETEPGVGATPAPETVRMRLLQVWILPQGLVKAAVAAGPLTTASVETGNPVLTFPLPAPLDDTLVKITLDPEVFLYHTMPTGLKREFSHRITRLETQFDGAAVDVSYSDYQDWNEADYKSDVLLPGRIVQTRSGETILDLTLTQSNTYNPYVVMPVPDNIPWDGAGGPGQ
jgi:hypothetical protein